MTWEVSQGLPRVTRTAHPPLPHGPPRHAEECSRYLFPPILPRCQTVTTPTTTTHAFFYIHSQRCLYSFSIVVQLGRYSLRIQTALGKMAKFSFKRKWPTGLMLQFFFFFYGLHCSYHRRRSTVINPILLFVLKYRHCKDSVNMWTSTFTSREKYVHNSSTGVLPDQGEQVDEEE